MKSRLEASFVESLLLFLFGPVIAVAHFMLVYLLAEAVCSAGGWRFRTLGMSGLAFVTLALTLAAASVTLLLARAAYRRRRGHHGDLAFTGFLLGILFALAILLIGIPPAFLRSC